MDERKLIYADDAIRWIKIECNPYGKPTLDFESGKKVIEYLERLPSAQPEKMQLSEEDATKSATIDCISRQAAIAVADSSDYVGLSVEDVKKVTDEVVKGLKRLPSAQPEQRKGTMLLNLNDNIKVKLTDLGKDIYYHQYDRTNKFVGKEICKPSFPKEDENGYTEFQLWCFMELYGPHMGMTLPNVIQPLDLIIEPERIIEHFEQMPSAQPEHLVKESGNLVKGLVDDCISRQAVLDKAYAYGNGLEPEGYCVDVEDIQALPSVQPEIIYCKDCVKHNKGHGYYLDGTVIGIKDCCPLVEIRGMAQGHEFDYQYCAYAERRQDEQNHEGNV